MKSLNKSKFIFVKINFLFKIKIISKHRSEINLISKEILNKLSNKIILLLSKINKKAGMVLLILSDTLFVFDNEHEFIYSADQELLLKSLELLERDIDSFNIVKIHM